jgi:hypothetical protein
MSVEFIYKTVVADLRISEMGAYRQTNAQKIMASPILWVILRCLYARPDKVAVVTQKVPRGIS